MKLVLGLFYVTILLLSVSSEDYYRDGNDKLYAIGSYGQRIYSDSKIEDAAKYKFKKLLPVLKFAWDLFINVDKKNFVMAPLSPQILLSALVKETHGNTQKEITNVVGFEDSKELEQLINNMVQEATSRELKIGNGFFVDFKDKVKKSFWDPEKSKNSQIDVINTNFDNAENVKKTYQNWIDKKTKGLIKNFDIDVDADTKMLLASTLYFKGTWQFAFNSTQVTDFHLPGGEIIKVDTMNIRKKYHTGKFDTIQATWAAVPYSSTEAMLIIVPDKDKTLNDLKQQMKGTDLTELISVISGQQTKNYLNITLPKFKLNTRISLKDPLQKMGIKNIFSSSSELYIFDSNQKSNIDQAIQQSVLEVDEIGTIGASATAFSVTPLMVQLLPIDSDLIVDRPFIAIIIDRKYGVPYFMAQITDPREN
ncbi:hypothetical protein PVAND_011359 [Polypedilum vanderplanki]|uniref:Serpin domain-containing protein n=1 Tax=Polypedilum vanderplanki TaxID=319348 RepID=A0A9J6CK56_POLVA|nr:hypothetical protein PVAND_011359 [Polypedilum vanderplanki]